MKKRNSIDFVLKDSIDGVAITPKTISFGQFNKFNQQVQKFVSGSEGLDLSDTHVSVEEGSYKLCIIVSVTVLSALEPELAALNSEDSLGEIDPKRAEIIKSWQAQIKKSDDRTITIRSKVIATPEIVLDRHSNYRVGDIEPWVRVEKYLFGVVTDIGGATRANVHIRLENSGEVVVLGSDQTYLKQQKKNRLYHRVLVRVEAEQHFRTDQLRNYRLISLEETDHGYDEEALNAFIDKGTEVWAEETGSAEWVRKLRGEAS